MRSMLIVFSLKTKSFLTISIEFVFVTNRHLSKISDMFEMKIWHFQYFVFFFKLLSKNNKIVQIIRKISNEFGTQTLCSSDTSGYILFNVDFL